MNSLNLLPIFVVGLLGSIHCIGMCGGIVGALSVSTAPRRPFPVAVVAEGAASSVMFDGALRVLSYNAGRIASYMTAGALAGGMIGGVRSLAQMSALQGMLYWLANLMLVALGLYLMDAWHGLTRLEQFGQILWRRIQPLTKNFLPMDTPLKALALGGLWGWLPCGMVYSVLLTATLSGSALSGAATMLAFGLGTLPMLLALGMAGSRLQGLLRRRDVRFAGGLIVLLFGLLGLVRAWHGVLPGWLDSFCIGVHP